MLSWQNEVVATRDVWLMRVKIFTVWFLMRMCAEKNSVNYLGMATLPATLATPGLPGFSSFSYTFG